VDTNASRTVRFAGSKQRSTLPMAGMLEFASNWMGEVGSVAVRFSSARLVTETSAFASALKKLRVISLQQPSSSNNYLSECRLSGGAPNTKFSRQCRKRVQPKSVHELF